LNYVDNLRLGIDAVGAAGGVVECAIGYSGDCLDDSSKYNLEYYLTLARQLQESGIHVLAIKDMAGLLKPAAATKLITALRDEFPDLPIHVHTHDTAGTGVATYLACANAGADAVDVAIDSMSGLTSQPAMGAVVGSLAGGHLDTGVQLDDIAPLIDYWESTRVSYAAFESGQKSGSAEVYAHEIPGGQYTNMLFQATQNGLAEQWPAVKKAYAEANDLLGDIVKVTPSSKTCGDLAQFMVTNSLSADDVRAKASSGSLNFPSSVVEFFQGALGIPVGGFPEPLRTDVLRGAKKLDETFEGRPGAELPDVDLESVRRTLEATHGVAIDDKQLMSAVMYPKVFEDFMAATSEFGDLSALPTRAFVEPMEVGEEVDLSFGQGVNVNVKLIGLGDLDEATATRECFFEVNGFPRSVKRLDETASSNVVVRPKADSSHIGAVGAPMPGVVVDVKVAVGDAVSAGDPMIVLSAMKMETVCAASIDGVVSGVSVAMGDALQPGDLLVTIKESNNNTADDDDEALAA
jgi:pyruvate carboxylase